MLWLGVLLLLGFGFGLGFLVSWPSLSESAEATSDAGVEYDISGFGTCNGSRIQVDRLWLWTQSPTPLRIDEVGQIRIGDTLRSFKGKNAVVWGGTVDLAGFTYDTVDGDTIVANKAVSTTGPTECHFTIDALSVYYYIRQAGKYRQDVDATPASSWPCITNSQYPGACNKMLGDKPLSDREKQYRTRCTRFESCMYFAACNCYDYPYSSY